MKHKKLTDKGRAERHRRIAEADKAGHNRQYHVTILKELLSSPRDRGYWEYID